MNFTLSSVILVFALALSYFIPDRFSDIILISVVLLAGINLWQANKRG